MSTASAQSNTIFIDSVADLSLLLDSIANLPVEPPSLYIDLEGINLGRHGSISIFSLHIAPSSKTYLIDVHSLGKAAFSTTSQQGISLKTILESPTIIKVVFDIRHDSDALFSLFQVSVNGIKDLQLMELAYRTGSRNFLSSLVECIEKDSPVSATVKTEWRRTKEHGGSYGVFNKRPLSPELTRYCVQDVSMLPGLYEVYNARLRQPGEAFWRVHVRHATSDRIKLSQAPSFDGKSKANAIGWDDQKLEEEIDSWNDDILMENLAGDFVMNEHDEWVPAPKFDFDDFLDGEEEDYDDWEHDTARDCIGWEEDMIRNGSPF